MSVNHRRVVLVGLPRMLMSMAMASSLLIADQPVLAAEAEEAVSVDDRATVVYAVKSGGPVVSENARAALLGSDDDVRNFLDQGWDAAQIHDDRIMAGQLAGEDSPTVTDAANAALDGTAEDVRAFLWSGFDSAWLHDERIRVGRALAGAGPSVTDAGQKALDDGDEAIAEFLSKGLASAREHDDRIQVGVIMKAGGPAVNAAGNVALDGTIVDVREFLARGQYMAQARDEEIATLAQLAQRAKAAQQEAARATKAAQATSAKAREAAASAKASAQTAAREATAAGQSAQAAASAAGRAADAASQAAAAAQEAIEAARGAIRAARLASNAAAAASAAAVRASDAAARARNKANAALTDRAKAGEARASAEDALAAAASAEDSGEAAKQAAVAIGEAIEAAKAALSAVDNAESAAGAADEAGGHAQVAQAQAQRAKREAEKARRFARQARRALVEAERWAGQAAVAAQEAHTAAKDAAGHARRAAAAARDAADRAGQATDLAAETQRHAEAANAAAAVSTAAATMAATVQRIARALEAERLRLDTAEATQAAQDAVAQEGLMPKRRPADVPELARVDAETTRLLTEASAAGATAEVVLDRGRRAALKLMGTGAAWTRAAAEDVLAGDVSDMRTWLAGGRSAAAEQDDHDRVRQTVESGRQPALRDAALKTLSGSHAEVARFIKTKQYPGKIHDDRIAIGVLIANGGPTMVDAGNAALDGTPEDQQEFLRNGQYVAAEHDNRIAVGEIARQAGSLVKPSPEVKAAADIAQDGPPSYRAHFLKVGQYKAAQRDHVAAVHAATAERYVADARRSAALARQDAARANELAANAKKDAAAAQKSKNDAAAAAKVAQAQADLAKDAHKKAAGSADQANQSAKSAREASAAANEAAEQARESVNYANYAAARAIGSAIDARNSADIAYQAAIDAGKDADAADLAAKQAYKIAIDKKLAEEAKSTHLYDDEKKRFVPLCPDNSLIKPYECQFPDLFLRSLDEGRSYCDNLFNAEEACNKVEAEDERVRKDAMIKFQMALTICGFAPGVGELCDGADALLSAAKGDYEGAATSGAAMVPFFGWASGSKRMVDLVRDAKKLEKRACRAPNSFVAGTRVLLAGGATKPIQDIEIGDLVLATDPIANVTAAKPVTALIAGAGEKILVDVGIGAEASDQVGGARITATDKHPFWLPAKGYWVDAEDLEVGDELRDNTGATTSVIDVTMRETVAQVYNFTVADMHTYYVLAGSTSVLVHNDSPSPPNIILNAIKNGTYTPRLNPDGTPDIFRGAPGAIARKWGGSQIYDVPGGGNSYRIIVNRHGDIGWISGHNYTKINLYRPPTTPDGGSCPR